MLAAEQVHSLGLPAAIRLPTCEQRLFAQKVSPEQDLIAARTAATEARIALRQAQSTISAAGGGGGSLNRLGIAAPISGQVIARPVVLGQTVAADAELYRIANLSQVSLALNLKPEDAGRVRPGNTVDVKAGGGRRPRASPSSRRRSIRRRGWCRRSRPSTIVAARGASVNR